MDNRWHCIPKIRHNHISTHPAQSLPLPFIETTRAIVGFVAGHSHRQTSHFLGVLNLHVTIAK